MTKEQAIDIIKCLAWHTRPDEENIEQAIKALEQQPSDDCVSRQELYKSLYERFHDEDAPNNITMVTLGSVRNFVKDFPPVTPTHGTCKDCRNATESQYNKCIHCSLIEHNCNEDFYCKEFKKRGSENG